MIKRSILWTRQPQTPVLIDTSNPLAKEFTSFLYPFGGGFFDACSSPLQNGANTAITKSVFQGGHNLEFNGTSSGINFGDVETVNFGGAYSIFILFRPDAQTGVRREMLLAKDVLGGRQFSIELNPKGTSGATIGQTGSIGHTRWSSGAAFYQKYSNANVVANGNWYSLLIGSTDGAMDIIAYLNGADLSLSAGSGSATGLVVNTATGLTAGRRLYSGAEDYFDGGIAAIGIANVAPSAALAKALYENPYQLLRKQQRNIYVGVSSGQVDYSLTCAAGAYTYTGQAATLSVNHSLTCSAGSYSYTGVAATLTVKHNLVCATGSYTYSGISAALSVKRFLSCASGSYAYSGVAATLSVNHGLSCSAGAYSYTGVAATLTYIPGAGTVSYVLSCAAGAYTYSGQSATLSVKHSLNCAAGSYAYSGVSASLQVAHRLTCAAGAYSYAGQSATLSVKRSLACATGTYDYIGNTAALNYLSGTATISYTLSCDAGAYIYTGQSATLSVVGSWPGDTIRLYSPITMTARWKSPISKTIHLNSAI